MEIQKHENSEDLIQIVKIRENSEFGKKLNLLHEISKLQKCKSFQIQLTQKKSSEI